MSPVIRYIAISLFLFAIPVLYNGLGSPLLSNMLFPDGIQVDFAKSAETKSIKTLGTEASPFCPGPVGKVAQEIGDFRKEVVAELHRLPALDHLGELTLPHQTPTPVATQSAAAADDNSRYTAQFDSEENSRRLTFFNLSQGLWFLSLIAIGIGIWAALHARLLVMPGWIFTLVTVGALMPPLVAFTQTDFGNDIHDQFRDTFIHNSDSKKDLTKEAYIQHYYSQKVEPGKQQIITAGTTGRLDALLKINTYLGFGSLGLIFWVMASLTSRLLVEGNQLQANELRAMRPIFQYALFAVGAVYALGIITQIALDDWAVLFARPYDKCLSLIVDQFQTFISSTYLIIILFSFAPAFLAWRFRTKALAVASSPAPSGAWLKQNGLDVTTLDFARSVVAVLLPVVIPHAVGLLPKVL
jgi:hypothetical protein